jgi:hypothetical protein
MACAESARTQAIILFFLGMSAGAPCFARDETRPGLRLSVADDFVHAQGSIVVSGRYGDAWGVRLGFWARDSHVDPGAPNVLAGVDRAWTRAKWRYGVGLVWIDETNKLNGTNWNFDAFLAYDLTDRLFVEYRHYSHGRVFGIQKDAANGGWNLIGVGFLF